MNRHRVVVSGIGIVSAAGGAEQCWRAIRQGESSVRPFGRLPEVGSAAAASVDTFNVSELTTSKLKKYMDRCAALAFGAASECLRDARLEAEERQTLDVLVGSCGSAIEWGEKQLRRVAGGSVADLHPHASVIGYPGNVVGLLTILLQLHGRGIVISDLDASGMDALGYAYQLIRNGLSKRVLVGATEAPLTSLVMMAMKDAGLLADCARPAAEISRPFDIERSGIVLGEGATMLLVEDYDAAAARGATPYSEIKSVSSIRFGGPANGDEPMAEGVEVIARALDDAGIPPGEVSYVNASACSLPDFDRSEAVVLREALDGAARHIPISSIKGVTGELLSASGLLQTAACAFSLRDGVLPPSTNLESADPDLDLDFIRGSERHAPLQNVLQTTASLLQPKMAAVVQSVM